MPEARYLEAFAASVFGVGSQQAKSILFALEAITALKIHVFENAQIDFCLFRLLAGLLELEFSFAKVSIL